MAYYRKNVVEIMQSWIGKNEADGSFKSIVDIYNTIKPLPRGYKAPYSTPWCAITVSAAFHKAGYDAIFPSECSCSRIIELSKPRGIWVENDAYIPSPGDCLIYDWDDSGKGNNTGAPDHIGMVESVKDGTITVIEGNYNDRVQRRRIAVNGRYIRGYVTPKFTAYEKPATPTTPTTSYSFKVGDVVEFTGRTHYVSASGTKGSACKPGKAKITQVHSGAHPYHCIAVSGGGSNVYGWVNAGDVKKISSVKEVKASAPAQKGPDNSKVGTYKVIATKGTAIRDNAGTTRKVLVTLPKGTSVQCYGYYSVVSGKNWYYVQTTYNNVKYTGFINSADISK